MKSIEDIREEISPQRHKGKKERVLRSKKKVRKRNIGNQSIDQIWYDK
jgi:hypothetical protein